MSNTNFEENSVPIHSSLNRPMLVLGGERKLVLMLGVIAGVFIVSLAQVWSAILGLIIWVAGQYFLSRAASYDTQLSQVAPRHFKYKLQYLSSATPFAPCREIDKK